MGSITEFIAVFQQQAGESAVFRNGFVLEIPQTKQLKRAVLTTSSTHLHKT
jgi:hypothetical protein